MQRVLYLFSVATLVAAVVVLASYLASRNTSWSGVFDKHWELLLLATGLLLLGLLVVGTGIRLFYSVADGFTPYVVAISLGVFAVGAVLVYLGIRVILSLG